MNERHTAGPGVLALVMGLGMAPAAHAADFFWSATADVFDWFDRETPNGPPGFSPWMLLGGGISGQAPDGIDDTATFSLSAKTTTYNSNISIDRATMNGGELQINGGTLTTINGITLDGPDAELSFTGGTVNNSAAPLTVNDGTIRIIQGSGTINSDVTTAGDFIIGGGGTLSLNRAGASFTQTGGSFDILSGGTASFFGNGHTLGFTGGTVTNDGTVTTSSSVQLNLGGVAFTNRGAVSIGSNSVVTMAGGSLDNAEPGASINIGSGSTFNYNGGSITGNAIRINGGTLNLNVPLGASGAGLGSPHFLITAANSALTGDIHQNITVTIGDGNGTDVAGTTGTFENRGNIVLAGVNSGSSTLSLQSGGGITNTGTVRAAFGATGSQDRRINSSSGGFFNNTAVGDLIVEASVQLTADVDLANTGDVTVGAGGSLIVGSGDRFDMDAGTLVNNGAVRVGSGSSSAVFRYAGGTITGNEIELNNGQLELDGGTGTATFRFTGGTLNELRPNSSAPLSLASGNVGDISAAQTVVVDAATGNVNLRRGTVFSGNFSFANAGTLRLTGAAPNGTPSFSLNGNSSTLTNLGLIHAQGIVGSSNQRTFAGSSGAQLVNSGQIAVDPDTTFSINLPITNSGSVTIGVGATFNSVGGSGDFIHNAGTLNNQGTFLLGSGDDFTYNGGTILGNAIDITQANLTLAPGTGAADFILRRGRLSGDVNPGQTVELRHDTPTGTVLTDTPSTLTNDGTIIFGGNGAGGHFFRIGELFQNLTLTNEGTFRTRNDDPLGNGGGRQINGVLDNRGLVVVEPNTTYTAVGTINHADFIVSNGASMGAVSGGPFTQQAGTLVNNGDIFFNGGRFEYNGGTITGNPITLDGGTLLLADGVNGDGTFIMQDGGAFGGTVGPNTEVHFLAPATGSRTLNLTTAPGNVIVDGLIVLDESAGGTIQLRTANAHVVEAGGQLRGSGSLSYQVFPGALTNRGTVAPGLDPSDPTGTLQVFGGFMQEPAGTLELDLGGTAVDDFDRLTATRDFVLAGTLDLSLTNGYTPVLGDTLNILTGTSGAAVVGTFDSVLQPAFMPAGLAFGVNYLPTLVELEVVAATILTGDYSGDGFVSQPDLDLVLLNWGDGVAPLGFDASAVPGGGPFDGLISQNELDGVLLNWGSGTPPPAKAIPEPASVCSIILGIVAGQRRPRRPA